MIRQSYLRALAAWTALAFLACGAALAQEAPAPAPAGVVDELTGVATAAMPGGQPRQLDLNAELQNQETVTTGPGASCQVRLADGTLLSIGESSAVTIVDASFDPQPDGAASAVCRLGRGTYRCLTGQAAARNPDRFRLETPLAVIGVRGTELGVVVGEKNVETGVFSGGPGFVTALEGGRPMQLRAGQAIARLAGQPFGSVTAISARLRGAVAAVPMRLSRDVPFAPPGKVRGRAVPPVLEKLRSGTPGKQSPGDLKRGKGPAGETGRGQAGTREERRSAGKAQPGQTGKGPAGGREDGQAAKKAAPGRPEGKSFLERAGEGIGKSARSAGEAVKEVFGKGERKGGDKGPGRFREGRGPEPQQESGPGGPAAEGGRKGQPGKARPGKWPELQPDAGPESGGPGRGGGWQPEDSGRGGGGGRRR